MAPTTSDGTECIRDRYSGAGADGERWVWVCPECGVAYDTAPDESAPVCDSEEVA